MPGHPSGELVIAIRNSLTALLLATCALAMASCGDESSRSSESETPSGEHFLSDQQKALEQSKAAAKAMEEGAAERARQTEDARNN